MKTYLNLSGTSPRRLTGVRREALGTEERELVKEFWAAFRGGRHMAGLSVGDEPPESWSFGDDPEMADRLGALVARGVKTATCSMLWEYESESETLPREGQLSLLLDGQGRPLCVLETVEVEVRPFDRVDAAFAHDEGEGDRSLAYWRKVHWAFFSRRCEVLGRSPEPSMPLVCERFRVLYTASAGGDPPDSTLER